MAGPLSSSFLASETMTAGIMPAVFMCDYEKLYVNMGVRS